MTSAIPALPPFLQHLPLVGHMPVPFAVALPTNGSVADFRILDQDHQRVCMERRRCGICGRKIRGQLAFIGPEGRAMGSDADHCFDFPWMHLRCAEYSLAGCPWLSDRKRERRAEDSWIGSDAAEALLAEHDALPSGIYLAPGGEARWDAKLRIFHFHAGAGGHWVARP